jgi:hypothetical protein
MRTGGQRWNFGEMGNGWAGSSSAVGFFASLFDKIYYRRDMRAVWFRFGGRTAQYIGHLGV